MNDLKFKITSFLRKVFYLVVAIILVLLFIQYNFEFANMLR